MASSTTPTSATLLRPGAVVAILVSFLLAMGVRELATKTTAIVTGTTRTVTYVPSMPISIGDVPYIDSKPPAEAVFNHVECSRSRALGPKELSILGLDSLEANSAISCSFSYPISANDIVDKEGLPGVLSFPKYLHYNLPSRIRTRQEFGPSVFTSTDELPWPFRRIISAEFAARAVFGLALAIWAGWRVRLEKVAISSFFATLSAKTLLIFTAPFIWDCSAKLVMKALTGGSLAIFNGALQRADLLALVLAPVAEELLYRAWMLPFLMLAMPFRWAAIAGSLIFALMHGYDGINTINIFIGGLLLSLLWRRSGSVLLCVAAHSMANVVLGLK